MARSDNGARLTGVIVSRHDSLDAYGGCYGEIKGENGRCYTYSGSQLFRNGSHPHVGGRVTFTVGNYCYATEIDRTDKHRRVDAEVDQA